MKAYILFLFLFSFYVQSFSQDLIVTSPDVKNDYALDSIEFNSNRTIAAEDSRLQVASMVPDEEIPDKISYKYLKNKYAGRPYSHLKSDKYDPTAAFLLSIVPGLGHVYAEEPLRGLAFLGGMAGSFGMFMLGAVLAFEDVGFGEPLGMIGALGFVGFYIANFADAVQVAKIKNLAFRNHDITFHILPNISSNNIYSSSINNFGVRLVFTF